jgi:AmmeMemoRadiSam system protein A
MSLCHRGVWAAELPVLALLQNIKKLYTDIMEMTLSAKEQKILLADARETIAAELENRSPRYKHSGGEFPVLQQPCGAFVTLHKIEESGNRTLRGCIGRMTAAKPLVETVRIMASEAAFGDPRFPPLRHGELEHCQIEISALSPLSACEDSAEVKVGVHGLYLIYGGRSGVLLPQVPVEQGWNLDQYLDYICIKAGLPAGSCDMPGAQLFTFTAVVFGEA